MQLGEFEPTFASFAKDASSGCADRLFGAGLVVDIDLLTTDRFVALVRVLCWAP